MEILVTNMQHLSEKIFNFDFLTPALELQRIQQTTGTKVDKKDPTYLLPKFTAMKMNDMEAALKAAKR